jgi:pyridoxal phosphate enzyme (YggS family)
MIGHLQTNKVKFAIDLFDMIQSVDSLSLIAEIEKQAIKINRERMDILIEVNVSGEAQKFGIAKENIFKLAEEVTLCSHVHLLGLMTMAPFTDDKNIIRQCFRSLRNLSDEIAEHFSLESKVEMKYLSMGMTHDYEIALEEGANMLRIGSAIFG